jgi:hypothetical protein
MCAVIGRAALIQLKAVAASLSNIAIGYREGRCGYCRSRQAQSAQPVASHGDRMMLNAGRGNPNFLATAPRHGFFQLGLFAMGEAERCAGGMPQGVAGLPKHLVRGRHRALYRALGIDIAEDANAVDYYTILDLEILGTRRYGCGFVEWLLANKNPLEILFRLADEAGVVLLPGKGFGTPHPSARVSLANLSEPDYVRIGRIILSVMEEYAGEYRSAETGLAVASPNRRG